MDLETARRTSDVQASDPTLGDPKAALTMHYFADFRCPHCRDLELSEPHRKLQENHIEKGDVKLVFVPFPVLGEDSYVAAEAAHQVWRQAPQVYWAWHKAMFESQDTINRGSSIREGIVQVARRFEDIDEDRLAQALERGEHRGEVERDIDFAHQWGAQKTPSLYLEGEPIGADGMNKAVGREAR